MGYYFIPANFTDNGKILGMFPIRNLIEAVLFGLPVLLLTFKYLPLSLTWRIIASMTIVVPVSGFALIGIDDAPITSFLRVWHQWRKHRRIMEYRGTAQ